MYKIVDRRVLHTAECRHSYKMIVGNQNNVNNKLGLFVDSAGIMTNK